VRGASSSRAPITERVVFRSYGSGYPGLSPLTRGVAPGSGFPFIFWPIVWKSFTLYNAFHHAEEVMFCLLLRVSFFDQSRTQFGSPSNSTRPGGPLATLDYDSAPNRTTTSIQILADTATLLSLSFDIYQSCGMYIDVNTTGAPVAYDTGAELDEPGPEQVIQYYRASSVALILDGYNNSAVYPNGPAEDTPLPTDIDREMISCINGTIGGRVPLVEAYRGSSSVTGVSPSMFSLGLIYLFYFVLRSMRIV